MDTAPRARFFAAEALGRIAYKPGGAAIVDMLADNDGHDMYIQHVGAIALAVDRRRQGARSALDARQARRCARPPSSPSAA